MEIAKFKNGDSSSCPTVSNILLGINKSLIAIYLGEIEFTKKKKSN